MKLDNVPSRLVVAVLVVLLALSAVAGVPRPVEAARAEPEIPTAGRFVAPVFDEVDVTHEIPYRQAVNAAGERQTLHLELYEPAGDTAERRPVILLVHGGYFRIGNNREDAWGAGPWVAELFARLGYVVASIEYRLRPDTLVYPEPDLEELERAVLDAHDDALAAVEWLRDRAADLRIDRRAIVPNGPSAGGIVAWNLAWMPGSRARPGPTGVPAAVSIAGLPFETSEITGEPLAAASPGDAPVLAIHGTVDDTVPFELAAGPCSRAASVGVRCDLVPLEGIGHPAIDPRFMDHVDAIRQRTIEFLAETVLAPLGYFDSPHPPGRPHQPRPARPARPARPDPPQDAPRPNAAPAHRAAQAPPATPIAATPTFTG